MLALAPHVADAGCPATYGSSCDPLSTGTDVCGATGDTWTCDGAYSSGPIVVWAVEDYDAATDYEAWGTIEDAFGVEHEFCCVQDSTNGAFEIDTIELLGTDADADQLHFTDDTRTYNMKITTGSSAQALVGFCYGYGNNDIFVASDDLNFVETCYGGDGIDTLTGRIGTEYLYGGSGNDTILGGPSADYLYGGTGLDSLGGGAGADTMYGDAGDDLMTGGSENDLMYGGTEPDRMNGNDGDDEMYGGDGGDVLCGGAHTSGGGDSLTDSDGIDEGIAHDLLYGGEDLDDLVDCVASSTQIDGNSTPSGPCHATLLTSPPSQCP